MNNTTGRLIMLNIYLIYLIIMLLNNQTVGVIATIGLMLGHLGLWVVEELEND
jgi:hypothetical protein